LPIFALLAHNASPAYADICLQRSINATAENVPANLSLGDENLLFDGAETYTGEKNLELKEPITPGEEALIFRMSMVLLADTTFEFFYEIDEADGGIAQNYADELNSNGYGAWYWDYDDNGVLDGADFDLGNDGNINIGTGDFSPLGIVVQLFNGDPGNPVGSGPGTLVHTAHSPIQQIENIVYTFTVTAPAEFDYLVIESTPDGASQDPRVIEIKHNGTTNFAQGADYGGSIDCGLLAHNYL
jgi:hypothetical protein